MGPRGGSTLPSIWDALFLRACGAWIGALGCCIRRNLIQVEFVPGYGASESVHVEHSSKELAAFAASMERGYDRCVPDKPERAIRVLEVEAEMNEQQATKFVELASYLSASDHKIKLETLAEEATQKAVQIRHQIRLMRDHQ